MQIARRFSITLSKRVAGDASSSVRFSKNTQCRGKSFAATVPSDSSDVKKKPKRVSKEERRAMVEAFVYKYRAMNSGKFPPTKTAIKQIGGSHYTIKKLVQELEYKYRRPEQHKDLSERRKPLSREDWNTNSNSKAEAKLQVPITAEQTFSQEISSTSQSENKDAASEVLGPELETSSLSEEPESNIEQNVSPVENFKVDDLKQMDEQKHSPELEKHMRELSGEHRADTPAESISTMWKNVKSLADGIFSMWKRL